LLANNVLEVFAVKVAPVVVVKNTIIFALPPPPAVKLLTVELPEERIKSAAADTVNDGVVLIVTLRGSGKMTSVALLTVPFAKYVKPEVSDLTVW
jgi:hypothetical protein